MSCLRYLVAGVLALWAGVCPGQGEMPAWEPPKAEDVYEVRDLRRAGEYLLERAVNCEGVIWLRIAPGTLRPEEREKLFFLLPSYRIAGLKVYPMSEELFMLAPEYKSCVRMLYYARGHRSISLTEKEQEALRIAQQALEKLGVAQMPPAEAALALHDWVALHAEYDVANANFDRTYGADEYTPFDGKYLFLEGKGVCDSYVQAYWLLLQLAGVPCGMVSGYVPKYQQGHAWNLVHLGDHWAHVDTTFDDPVPDKKGQVVHTNFDKSDEEMRESRSWAQDLFPNTRQDGFLAAQPVLLGTVEDLVAWLREQPSAGEEPLVVEVFALRGAPDAPALVEQAAAAAGIPLTAGHDILYPHALRLRRKEHSPAS